jgi:hypothetical protein
MALSGDLNDFPLEDILKIIHGQKKTGILSVSFKEEQEEKEILIYFYDGEVVNINHNTLFGKPAIEKLASVSQGKFDFHSSEDLQIKQTSKLNFDDFLKIYKESADKWQPVRKLFPSLTMKVFLSEAGSGKVDFKKEEWKLITSIGEGITIKELLEKLGLGELDILYLLKNLKEKSVIKVEENKEAEIEKEFKDIIPIALVWYRGKPINDEKAVKLLKLIDNKKNLLTLSKELGVSVAEAKKSLDYLISVGRVSIKRKK